MENANDVDHYYYWYLPEQYIAAHLKDHAQRRQVRANVNAACRWHFAARADWDRVPHHLKEVNANVAGDHWNSAEPMPVRNLPAAANANEGAIAFVTAAEPLVLERKQVREILLLPRSHRHQTKAENAVFSQGVLAVVEPDYHRLADFLAEPALEHFPGQLRSRSFSAQIALAAA